MKNKRNDIVINCPNFEKNRDLLLASKRKINQTNRPVEKSIYAEDVEEIANIMLHCNHHDENAECCAECQAYATHQKRSVATYTGSKVFV
jgi:hypothetical protein